jgi:hypothetical protein
MSKNFKKIVRRCAVDSATKQALANQAKKRLGVPKKKELPAMLPMHLHTRSCAQVANAGVNKTRSTAIKNQ